MSVQTNNVVIDGLTNQFTDILWISNTPSALHILLFVSLINYSLKLAILWKVSVKFGLILDILLHY